MNTISKYLAVLALLSGPVVAGAQTITIDSISDTVEAGNANVTNIQTTSGLLQASASAAMPYGNLVIPIQGYINLSYFLDPATGTFGAGGTTYGCGEFGVTCSGRIDLTFTTTGTIDYTLQVPNEYPFTSISGIPGGGTFPFNGCFSACSHTLGAGTYTLDLQSNDQPQFDGLGVEVNFNQPVIVGAPEIDPASAASGLTLLVGALLTLGARRKLLPARRGPGLPVRVR